MWALSGSMNGKCRKTENWGGCDCKQRGRRMVPGEVEEVARLGFEPQLCHQSPVSSWAR